MIMSHIHQWPAMVDQFLHLCLPSFCVYFSGLDLELPWPHSHSWFLKSLAVTPFFVDTFGEFGVRVEL